MSVNVVLKEFMYSQFEQEDSTTYVISINSTKQHGVQRGMVRGHNRPPPSPLQYVTYQKIWSVKCMKHCVSILDL